MLEILIAAIMVAALIVYALMGGADYGGGMWDLLASGSRAKRQRQAIVEAIAPIWEANHVWLILVVCFVILRIPPRLLSDNDRVTYSHHRYVNRHRSARFRICISKIRFHRGRCSTPMEYNLWNRQFLHAFFPGPNLGCINYRQHPFSGRSNYYRFLRGLAYALCVDLWVVRASAL